MKIEKHIFDQMTPAERRQAIDSGASYDRVPCVPFMGELKCYLSGVSIWDFWHEADAIVHAEVTAFNRYGYDRIVIGPNSRGITEALGGKTIYPEVGLPYADRPLIEDYTILDTMAPVNAKTHPRIQAFAQAADRLSSLAGDIVPIEASIGGPFTIASNLRGVEKLLRDCRKYPDEVDRLLRLVTDSQKSCIDMAAAYGLGIAMADPVANPALIGPRMYEKLVFPYTMELTEYALEKTGKKVSLHMCGNTRSIWKYLIKYPLNELSLDNIVDLSLAVEELGDHIPIAGNVDPVGIIMNGTKEEITEAVQKCIRTGIKAHCGYTLATGCDIPELTAPEQVDYMMDAARLATGYF